MGATPSLTSFKSGTGADDVPSMYSNTIVGVEKYQLLVAGLNQSVDGTTAELLARQSGLTGDIKGARGALRMLEVLRRAHSVQSDKNQVVWFPGRQPQAGPVRDPEGQDPYRRLCHVLTYFKGNFLATDALMRDCGIGASWEDVTLGAESPEFDSSQRKAFLGALKLLTALGLVTYRNHTKQAVAWCWGSESDKVRDYFKGLRLEGRDVVLSFDAPPGPGQTLNAAEKAWLDSLVDHWADEL